MGSFGSESKGRVTGAVVQRRERQGYRVVAVRTAGPNAGHVIFDEEGRRFALRCVPVAAVASRSALLFIGPGSEVDLGVLQDEIEELEEAGHAVRGRLFASEHATWLEPQHRVMESGSNRLEADLVKRTGSTGKGVGAARSERIWRRALTLGQVAKSKGDLAREWAALGVQFAELADYLRDDRWLRETLAEANAVSIEGGGERPVATVIEGTQGYGLGLHTAAYPQTTSSDCRAVDFMAMAGLDPWFWKAENVHIHVVVRPNPIRVAGNSGPLKGETTWAALGLPEEQTTVTKLTRRVGEFDPQMVRDACEANGAVGGANVWVSVAMLDHVVPELAGVFDAKGFSGAVSVEGLEKSHAYLSNLVELTGCAIGYIGTGPSSTAWAPDLGFTKGLRVNNKGVLQQ